MKPTRKITDPYTIFLLAFGAALLVTSIAPPASAADVVLERFKVGYEPFGLAFDGASVWVVNLGDDTVTKLRAKDGANQGTFGVGNSPSHAAYDGANIWVTSSLDNTVTKLRAADGTLLGIFAAGAAPEGIVFDGANLWITNGS